MRKLALVRAQIQTIVSSFHAVLMVDIDLHARTVRSSMLDAGKGIYFGLTGDGNGGLLLAARNRDTTGRIRSPAIGTDIIHALDPHTGVTAPLIAHRDLVDLHQIRRIGRFLCVVQGRGSALIVFDLRTRELTRRIDLQSFVPAHLRHGTIPGHADDPYHFNSISWTGSPQGGSLVVLAHNWGDSFALELGCVLDARGPNPVSLIAVHETLGRAAHDVAYVNDTLFVLDSAGGKLITRGTTERRSALPQHPSPTFARGLAITDTHVLVAYGFWSSEAFNRIRTPTRLCVLDRATLAPVLDADLGTHGNSTDIRVISEADHCDAG